jgi:uncharacterized protein with FMN-binding domain
MKRIVLFGLSTLSSLVLLFGYSTSTSGPLGASSQTAILGTPATTSTGKSSSSTPSSTPSATPSSGGSTSTTTSSKVTGSVAQTQWGPVQVQLTVAGGKITDIAVVQYPNGNGRDQEINSYALPILMQETVQKQSAQIDMVSGATITSGGYVESLQSALDKASL